MTDDLETAQVVSPDAEAQGEPVGDMLDKNTVSKIVERERLKAFEKGKQEAIMELQQQQQEAPQQESAPVQAPQQAQAPQQLGGMQQMSPADIERIIAEKLPQLQAQRDHEMRNEQIASSFVSKMQAAETKYPGLEAKLEDLDYTSLAPLISMANNMENTGDIMKELTDNPLKMGNLLTLMYTQPKLAQKAMIDLSQSIKVNQDALAQEAKARDPMTQLKPSMNAGMDNNSAASLSVRDLQKMLSGR